MLIDSHVNLHAHQFDEDRDEVIARARAAGIGLMVNISDKVSGFAAVRALADHPDIWCTVGTHPHEAKENPDLSAAELVAIAADPRVVGIGETGLDFHYDLSPRDIQAKVFRQHAIAARQTGLPLVVHSREADDLMGDILEGVRRRPVQDADALLYLGSRTRGAGCRAGRLVLGVGDCDVQGR